MTSCDVLIIRDDLGLMFNTCDVSFILIDVIHVWWERLKNATLYHFQPYFRSLLGIFLKSDHFYHVYLRQSWSFSHTLKKWVVTPVEYILNAQIRVIKRKKWTPPWVSEKLENSHFRRKNDDFETLSKTEKSWKGRCF